MEILYRDTLPRGGFAGLREHRVVMDPRVFGSRTGPGTWPGVGNFVYLADARFMPRGETQMHGHKEVDVISVMVEGRIAHRGSLEHGQELSGRAVQVQRAGGEGFEHNEVNPDDAENRMIQLWVLPETPGEPAGYKLYEMDTGDVARIYGGVNGQDRTYAARTIIDVALPRAGQRLSAEGGVLAYLVAGEGTVNGGTVVTEGALMRGPDLAFTATGDAHLILISTLGLGHPANAA